MPAITLSHGQVVNHLVNGSGSEPGGIQQFKTYAMVFEPDTDDIARISIRVRTNNCNSGYSQLGEDVGRDVKKMVRVGLAAAGQQLCVRVSAPYIPAGQTRKVYLFNYWSQETAMR
jgi:hypothetical protein